MRFGSQMSNILISALTGMKMQGISMALEIPADSILFVILKISIQTSNICARYPSPHNLQTPIFWHQSSQPRGDIKASKLGTKCG